MNNALSTKEKIVELARDYIQKIGYHSFNYKQIATYLDIKNAAIHHYFPSKDDLGVAVIEKDRQEFITMIQRLAKDSGTEKLEFLLNTYLRFFEDDRKLCIIGTFCSTYQDLSPKIQFSVKQYMDLFVSWLSEVLQQGLDTGEFRFDSSVNEMTNSWITALTGSLHVGRIRGPEYMEGLQNNLRKSLKNSSKN